MTDFYNPILWVNRVPAGVAVISTLDPDGYYQIPASQTIAFPWGITGSQKIVITALHQQYWQRQQLSVRAWPSLMPGGSALQNQPFSTLFSLNLSNTYTTWCLYPPTATPITSASVNQWAPINECLWFNIQNLCNEDNNVYCNLAVTSL
jgi:hypothetical protein